MMLVLRATVKFCRELKVKPVALEEDPDVFPGTWFGDLLWFNRKKCVIFTHAITLYSVFVSNVRRNELADPAGFFREHLLRVSADVGLAHRIRALLPTDLKCEVAKTNNRSVVGSMVEMGFMSGVHLRGVGGPRRSVDGNISAKINETPMFAAPDYPGPGFAAYLMRLAGAHPPSDSSM